MIDPITIPGANELLGKGVYRGLPDDLPQPIRDRKAIVIGEPDECSTAASQLAEAGWNVTVVTREPSRHVFGSRSRRRVAKELVCATGVEYLEVVVLRRLDTGRIDACNASALFIV